MRRARPVPAAHAKQTRIAQGGDLATRDDLPACPRCGDLCAPGSLYCVECGCRITEPR